MLKLKCLHLDIVNATYTKESIRAIRYRNGVNMSFSSGVRVPGTGQFGSGLVWRLDPEYFGFESGSDFM